MSKNRQERLRELLDRQKRKENEVEKRRQYELVLEEVRELFPNNHFEGEAEVLSEEDSQKIIDELFEEFPFCTTGIEWPHMFFKTIFSNHIDYESALAELVIKNHKVNNQICFIIDFNYKHVIKTKLISIIHRIEEVRNWDRYIYSPQNKLVIEFPSNDIVVGWKNKE